MQERNRKISGDVITEKLPGFLVVGPQRTATTWLQEALEEFTVLPAGVQETMFFDRHYGKGIDWYKSHFLHADGDRIIGEVAPTYFHSEQARERVAAHMPDCKIICTLRNPVDRLYSLYRLMREYGMTRQSFEDALISEPDMLESSRYAYHVNAWIERFGRNNVKVLFNEQLYQSPQDYFRQACDFIGLEGASLNPAKISPTEKEFPARNYYLARLGQSVADQLRARRLYWILNVAKALHLRKVFFSGGDDLPPMAVETANRLREKLRPEVEALEVLLDVDLDHWKSASPTSQETAS